MSDIFISYHREDLPIARRLATALVDKGWSVSWDRKLHAGETWDNVIERELRAAECVIVIWSENSIRSAWVKEEASYARERSVLLQVLIQKVRLPLGFRSVQSVDLSDWKGQKLHSGFRRLVEAISDFSGDKAEASASVPRPMPREASVDVPDFLASRDVDAPWCPELVVMPAGMFLMGSPWFDVNADDSERPQHRVTIAHRFAVAKYPTTFAEYDHFVEATGRMKPRDEGWGRGRRPVVNVSWLDAKAYIAWLSQETSIEYSLLTEAEWEYACRAGSATSYAFGNTITEINANFGGTIGKTSEVGVYPPNAWGLYDMHGNVWEWVEDVWHSDYAGAPIDGLAWTEGDDREVRVSRGGSWINAPEDLRSACRDANTITNLTGSIGFRVARRLRL